MTIGDLIKILQKEDEDLEVVITHAYRDHADNTVAEEPYHFDKGFIAHSNYHDSDRVVEEGDDEARPALLIGGP